MFTPGVPREMRRMLDEQVIPRLLALGGIEGVTRLKRFHSFGVGESRADEMLTQALKSALALVDVRVLDHLIVAGGDILSFAERGLL